MKPVLKARITVRIPRLYAQLCQKCIVHTSKNGWTPLTVALGLVFSV